MSVTYDTNNPAAGYDRPEPERDEPVYCLIGGHRHPGTTIICDQHLNELPTLIDGVARMTHQLALNLMPGTAATGEKVTSPNPFSSTPTNFNALNLIGPGVTELRRDRRSMAVQVRRWSTVSTYDVTAIIDDQPVTQRRQLRFFHSELITDGRTSRPCACGEPHDTDTGRPTEVPPWLRGLRSEPNAGPGP